MRLIDADALRIFLDRQYHNGHGYIGNKKEVYREALLAVKSYVYRAGQIDAESVRHGHWEYNGLVWHCSECVKNPTYGMGFTQNKNNLFNYCPNCGARMDEEKEE